MHNIEQVIRRLRLSGSGTPPTAGEIRMLFIHLLKKVEDLENEISLCRSQTCGATGEVPRELLNQLSPNGGICVIPIKKKHISGNEFLYRYTKNGNQVKEEELIAVRFVPFIEKRNLLSKIVK